MTHGCTQENKLAEKAGITPTYTSDLERGEKVPSLTIALRVARAPDMSVSEVLQPFTREIVRELSLR